MTSADDVDEAPGFAACWMALADGPDHVTGCGTDLVGPIASTGKIPVLAALAVEVTGGRIGLADRLPILQGDRVGGSGLLRFLSLTAASVSDLAVLTAAVSDNIATNVLLRRLGLPVVADLLETADVPDLAVLDQVRDVRDANVPSAFATGTARALCRFLAAVGSATAVPEPARDLLLGWMRHNRDQAWVADAFDASSGPEVVNKTGWDTGVITDAGLVLGGGTDLAYAAVARWPGTDGTNGPGRRRAVHLMRAFGATLAQRAQERST